MVTLPFLYPFTGDGQKSNLMQSTLLHLSLFHPSFDPIFSVISQGKEAFATVRECVSIMRLSAPFSIQSNAQTRRWHSARLDMEVEAGELVNTHWKQVPRLRKHRSLH